MWYRLFLNLHNLRKNMWLKTSEIEKIQQKRLRAILKHAYDNVPYYHKLFDSVKIKPYDIKNSDDLLKIPITTKSKFLGAGSAVTPRDINMGKFVTERTSGSLGMPFDIIRRKKDYDFLVAVLYREFFENGLRFRDKRVSITGERTFSLREKQWFRRLGLMKKISLSVFDKSENLISDIIRIQPDVISGYSSILELLAMEIEEKGIEKINPRLIFTHAELLDQNRRNRINSVFGVELSDLYGCMEVGPIAWECSAHEGYHINIDSVIVEFIKDGEKAMPGERGEIVVTGLASFAMPFIRYQVGDVGVYTDQTCSCGRGLPLMKGIEGRLVDFILLPNGELISPYVLTFTAQNIPGIKRYQIIQEKRNLITIRFIKNETFTKDTLNIIKREYKKVLGSEIEINPINVDDLPNDASGKFKIVKSLVSK